MKNIVFWDVLPCGSCENLRFGGNCRLHLQGENNERTRNTLAIASDTSPLNVFTLKLDAIRHVPEDEILLTYI
jgi:hypothetical protein